MTLVDTSVWVDHFRYGVERLRTLLERGEALCHPFVIGELASGSIANRVEVLSLLKALPESMIAHHDEAMHFLQERRLYGQGMGWIDVHLLASASLGKSKLWTKDRALKRAAEKLGIREE